MLKNLHSNKGLQLKLGLVMGIIFGFLLHKGGFTNYDIILKQLLLRDWTVVKIMLSAIITGTLGVHWLKSIGYAKLHLEAGGVGVNVIGGLIFGAGFAVLGYCPAIVPGAIGHGALDALCGGLVGITLGAGMFAAVYPKLNQGILRHKTFTHQTLPELLNVDPWVVVIPVVMVLVFILWLLEYLGL